MERPHRTRAHGLSLILAATAALASGAAQAAVVINEVDYDQPGTDATEYIELHNTGAAVVSLGGYTLQLVNGASGGAAVYLTITLPAGDTIPAGGHYVICGTGSPVSPCQFKTGAATNLIQNGNPDAVALLLNGTIVDRFSYGGDVPGFTEGTGVPVSGTDSASIANISLSRCPDGSDSNVNSADFKSTTSTPGAGNACGPVVPPIGGCSDPATKISAVQGSTSSSPLAGSSAIVQGVVVGDFQGTAGLSGFFVQEEAADQDGSAATSEGLFVFDASFGVAVGVGDVVRVQGTVTEFFDLTELTSVTGVVLCATGAPLPPPQPISFPLPSVASLEPLEGMRVSLPSPMFVTETFNLGRFGEVGLSASGQLFTPTNVVLPGAPAQAMQDLQSRSVIQLDDGSNVENPLPLPPYLGSNGTLRPGDGINNVQGVLGYGFGFYEVHPTAAVTITTNNPRPAPPVVPGRLKLASVNVLNYFTTLDAGAPSCGIPSNPQDCRGANTAAEFTRQKDKIRAALLAMGADIYGVAEIENNASASLDSLVGLLGAGYDYVHVTTGNQPGAPVGTIGGDAIKVAFVYKAATVEPVGAAQVLDNSVNPTFTDRRSRPALAQTFREKSTGHKFTAVMNHLKSKGSACTDPAIDSPLDPDTGDGQGNCNLTRKKAAVALKNWLLTDPTGSGDPDVVILGDLNSYSKEDPVRELELAGYTNQVSALVGPQSHDFLFEGQSGSLTHLLTSPSLGSQVAGLVEWHINATEPRAFDYNDFNQPLLYAPDQFRAADHEPVILGLDLAEPKSVPASSPRSALLLLASLLLAGALVPRRLRRSA